MQALLASALTFIVEVASAICTINATGVAFGAYDTFNAVARDSTGNVGVICAPSLPYTIAISAGAGSYASRTLRSGANQLSYNLYTDATYTSVWGDGTGGTGTVAGNALSANHTVYGRIPARQNVPVGIYAETLTVTITF